MNGTVSKSESMDRSGARDRLNAVPKQEEAESVASPVSSPLMPRSPQAPMAHEICCINFRGLIAFVRNHYGEKAVQAATAGLVDGEYWIDDRRSPDRPVPLELRHLTDPACWVSNELSLRLFENVASLIPAPEPLRVSGAGAVRENLSRTILFVSRLLGPQRIARRVSQFNTRFNRTKTVDLAELSHDRAVFALRYQPGFRVTRHVCQ